MFQVADRLRERRIAPLVTAGFLNYSEPTLAECVAHCQAQGATDILVQPYFLISGTYVGEDLPRQVRSVIPQYPTLRFALAEALGAHPALVKLACQRLAAVDPTPTPATALLVVAHGTPRPSDNAPIQWITQRVQQAAGYATAAIGYLDCNQPDIPAAFDQLMAAGAERIAVLPYFLHLGRHVNTDLPLLFAQAQVAYPTVEVQVAQHLAYDPLLAEVTAERVMASLLC